jgi:hypothetical protein
LAEREDFSGWRFLVAALLGMTGGLGMRPRGGGSSKRLVVGLFGFARGIGSAGTLACVLVL